MRKLLLTAAVAAAFAAPVAITTAHAQAAAAAPTSPHTLTGNMSFVSDYRFRSISQTYKGPALQGGFDYSHAPTGLYAGTWASNVSGNQYTNGNGLEMDFYGGWKKELFSDFTIDLGLLYYWYQGAQYNSVAAAGGNTPSGKFDNTEIYIGATWKWFTAKYNYATSDYFGLNTGTLFRSTVGSAFAANSTYCGTNNVGQSTGVNQAVAAGLTGNCIGTNRGGSKGTGYFDLSGAYDFGNGWGINGHVGILRVKNYSEYNYTDYKLGVTKDIGNGFTIGASAYGNNAKSAFYTAAQSGGVSAPTGTKNVQSSTLVLSIAKTF